MTAADARPPTPAGRLATIDLEQELAVAVATADAAGSLVLAAFRQPAVVCRKGRHDVVTSMDLTSERLIMDRLGTAFPADRRLGEETGRSRSPRGAASDRTWIVDPLDGTVNYAAGLPIWCVSIALAIGPDVVLGVIRDAVHDATMAAIRGRGAWRVPGGGPLTVRRLRRVADAVVAADPGTEGDASAEGRIASIRQSVRAVRVPGSIAWSLTALASGHLDGVVQVRGLQAVDVAAAGLIALEAGARVTAADGGPWLDLRHPFAGRGIAAGRPGVHRMLVGAD